MALAIAFVKFSRAAAGTVTTLLLLPTDLQERTLHLTLHPTPVIRAAAVEAAVVVAAAVVEAAAAV